MTDEISPEISPEISEDDLLDDSLSSMDSDFREPNEGVPTTVALQEDDLSFVTLMEQWYSLKSRLPTLQEATNDLLFESDEYQSYLAKESVLAALQERGLIIRGIHVGAKLVDSKETANAKNDDSIAGSKETANAKNDDSIAGSKETANAKNDDISCPSCGHLLSDSSSKQFNHKHSKEMEAKGSRWNEIGITPIQMIVANSILDAVDTRSDKKKLQDLGVSTAQYSRWLQDPAFQKYITERAELMLPEGQFEAHRALLDKVRMGDMSAIKYFNEITGRFVQERANLGVTVNNGVSVHETNFQQTLIKILEVINDTVSSVDEKMLIADKLRELAGNANLAKELTGTNQDQSANNTPVGKSELSEAIPVPKVIPNRQVPEDLKKLMQ